MSIIKKMSKLVFREIEGDLFSAPKTYALAHCVAADLKMGKGIAVAFRDKFKQVDKLKEQGVTAGGVAVLKDDSRFIYYLISKNDTYKKPTYKDLFSSLHAMKDHMVREYTIHFCTIILAVIDTNCENFHKTKFQVQNNVTQLAIPRIGCGLDGLSWDKVKDQLHEVFGDIQVEIDVYTFKRG